MENPIVKHVTTAPSGKQQNGYLTDPRAVSFSSVGNKGFDFSDSSGHSLDVDPGVADVKRKLTFPYRRPKLEDLEIPIAVRTPSLRSKSETHVKHLSSRITVQDMKKEWLEFTERNGSSGLFSLGVLVSEKPPNEVDATPGKEGLTLLHFSTIEDAELELKSLTDQAGGTGRKRQVAFADEMGKPLCEVKVIKQPKEVPEELENAFVWALIYEKIIEDRQIPAASWELDFIQPESQPQLFSSRLDQNMVTLESAQLDNRLPCRLIGLICVKNITFAKVVFVRITSNKWLSYRDHSAVYQKDASDSEIDTFTFEFQIPKDEAKRDHLEFCVCFEAEGKTRYWDNNDGDNYWIVSQTSQMWWTAIEEDGAGNIS